MIFTAVSNSNIYDVCLNTYGTLDLLTKLMTDNDFGGVNESPLNGQVFEFDETLAVDLTASTIRTNLSNAKYATRFKKIFDPPNEDLMVKYEQLLEWQYTAAAEGETVIIIPDLIGVERIAQIEKEIKPLFTADYSFNTNTGQITLLNGVEMTPGETLFILYAVLITA